MIEKMYKLMFEYASRYVKTEKYQSLFGKRRYRSHVVPIRQIQYIDLKIKDGYVTFGLLQKGIIQFGCHYREFNINRIYFRQGWKYDYCLLTEQEKILKSLEEFALTWWPENFENHQKKFMETLHNLMLDVI